MKQNLDQILEPFRWVKDPASVNETEYSKYRQQVLDTVTLPSTMVLPARKKQWTAEIVPDEGTVFGYSLNVVTGNPKTDTRLDDINALDDMVTEADVDVVLVGDIKHLSLPYDELCGFYFTPIQGSENLRMINFTTSEDKEFLCKDEYLSFLFLTEKRRNHPDNIFYAHQWLRKHLMFWEQQVDSYYEPSSADNTFSYNIFVDENGVTYFHFSIVVNFNKEGKPELVEATTETFEEGVLELASKLDERYDYPDFGFMPSF